jgi:hypothetical protein
MIVPRYYLPSEGESLLGSAWFRLEACGHLKELRPTKLGGVIEIDVKTYGEVMADYEFHPEAKCADSQGTNAENRRGAYFSDGISTSIGK